jgi:hypothetical protein
MTKRQEKLSPHEWQLRHDAACAVVARKYCDMFAFWRACPYKPCRSARRCRGDQKACLRDRYAEVSYEEGRAAHAKMIADTPRNAGRFTRGAHNYEHHSWCLHALTSKAERAQKRAKPQARTEAKAER